MAALIENNEGHIEHMVAVVSPFPSYKGFSQTLSLPKPKICLLQKKPIQRTQKFFSSIFFLSLSGLSTVTLKDVGQSVGEMLTPLRR